MIHVKKRFVLFAVCVCVLLLGCNRNTATDNDCDLKSTLDYVDWFYDIKNTGTYNYVKWIELDVWFKESIADIDFTGITYDVLLEGQTIVEDSDVVVDDNFVKCYYNSSFEGAELTDNGFLAPGAYEIILKDEYGNTITSSTCIVTAESGDTLSKMVVDFQQLYDQENQLSFRISFNGDITPYSKAGFYITISIDEGITYYIPDQYTIELADTYMIIKCPQTDTNCQNVLISVYCGDGTLVCDIALDS